MLHVPVSCSVAGFGGQVFLITTYLVELTVRNASPLAVEVLAHPEARYVLPGRDILNNDRVILDSSKQILDIVSSQLNPGGFRGERQSSILIRSG